jgi:hypothetical protein
MDRGQLEQAVREALAERHDRRARHIFYKPELAPVIDDEFVVKVADLAGGGAQLEAAVREALSTRDKTRQRRLFHWGAYAEADKAFVDAVLAAADASRDTVPAPRRRAGKG